MKHCMQQEESIPRQLYKQYNVNPNISQVFSLGILLLSITTKCNPVNLYSPPFEINAANIGAQLEKLKSSGYSRLLLNLVKIMLSPYKNRPLPSQIRQIFKESEAEILSLSPFDLSMVESRVSSGW